MITEWKALAQLLKRQRFREAYRTQVEEHEFDNQVRCFCALTFAHVQLLS